MMLKFSDYVLQMLFAGFSTIGGSSTMAAAHVANTFPKQKLVFLHVRSTTS
eukprot:c4818_g1_i1 orf=168-320(+)